MAGAGGMSFPVLFANAGKFCVICMNRGRHITMLIYSEKYKLKGETMDNEKAYAVFVILKDYTPHGLKLVDHSDNFPNETARLLRHAEPYAGDGLHITSFVFDDGPSTGKLTNTMPGSDFEHFSFAKVRLLGKGLVVGRYW